MTETRDQGPAGCFVSVGHAPPRLQAKRRVSSSAASDGCSGILHQVVEHERSPFARDGQLAHRPALRKHPAGRLLVDKDLVGDGFLRRFPQVLGERRTE
jgi:hypothetical protein